MLNTAKDRRGASGAAKRDTSLSTVHQGMCYAWIAARKDTGLISAAEVEVGIFEEFADETNSKSVLPTKNEPSRGKSSQKLRQTTLK